MMGSAVVAAAVSRAMPSVTVAGRLASTIASTARDHSPDRLTAASMDGAVTISAPQPLRCRPMASR
jgi:hypothetical protein